MVLIATWGNTLLNLLIVRRIRPSRTGERDLPLVSVLIPRGGRRIVPRLTSLPEQNYPHYEILMLDDNSEDATRRCAEAIASRSSGHLRIISGTTLPEGWTGESWACHQRAWEATGSFLLFTDADTAKNCACVRMRNEFRCEPCRNCCSSH